MANKYKCNHCSYRCEKCEQEKKEEGHYKSDTLCWCCARSVPNKEIKACEWVKKKQPVRDWKAIPHRNKDDLLSYHVIECPLFVKG